MCKVHGREEQSWVRKRGEKAEKVVKTQVTSKLKKIVPKSVIFWIIAEFKKILWERSEEFAFLLKLCPVLFSVYWSFTWRTHKAKCSFWAQSMWNFATVRKKQENILALNVPLYGVQKQFLYSTKRSEQFLTLKSQTTGKDSMNGLAHP